MNETKLRPFRRTQGLRFSMPPAVLPAQRVLGPLGPLGPLAAGLALLGLSALAGCGGGASPAGGETETSKTGERNALTELEAKLKPDVKVGAESGASRKNESPQTSAAGGGESGPTSSTEASRSGAGDSTSTAGAGGETAGPAPKSGSGPAPQGSASQAEAAGKSEPPPTIPAAELLEKAKKFARDFAAALAKGDAEAAMEFLVTAEELEDVLMPGVYSILSGTIIPQNRQVVAKLAEQLGGKSVEVHFDHGKLSTTAQGTFRKRVPILNQARLELTVEGTAIPVRLDQVIWTQRGWRIFRIRL